MDRGLSNWTEWTKCDQICRGRTEERSVTIIREQQGDGKSCNETEEAHPCNTQPCPFLLKYVFLLKLVNNTQ